MLNDTTFCIKNAYEILPGKKMKNKFKLDFA